MNVYTRLDGRLARFQVATKQPHAAIGAVEQHLNTLRANALRSGPVLAVVDGGKRTAQP